jgi:hypothetical protein
VTDATCIEVSEHAYCEELDAALLSAQQAFATARQAMAEAEVRLVKAQGAHESWADHLARRYEIGPGDQITDEGVIVRAPRAEGGANGSVAGVLPEALAKLAGVGEE